MASRAGGLYGGIQFSASSTFVPSSSLQPPPEPVQVQVPIQKPEQQPQVKVVAEPTEPVPAGKNTAGIHRPSSSNLHCTLKSLVRRTRICPSQTKSKQAKASPAIAYRSLLDFSYTLIHSSSIRTASPHRTSNFRPRTRTRHKTRHKATANSSMGKESQATFNGS